MEIDYLESLEDKLTRDQFIQFLIRLGFNLTVTARNAYQAKTNEVDKPNILRGINEIEHRVLSQVLHLMKGAEGPSYKSLIIQIYELTKIYKCQMELENAVRFSLEKL